MELLVKRKDNELCITDKTINPYGMFAAGEALVPTQEKKTIAELRHRCSGWWLANLSQQIKVFSNLAIIKSPYCLN